MVCSDCSCMRMWGQSCLNIPPLFVIVLVSPCKSVWACSPAHPNSRPTSFASFGSLTSGGILRLFLFFRTTIRQLPCIFRGNSCCQVRSCLRGPDSGYAGHAVTGACFLHGLALPPRLSPSPPAIARGPRLCSTQTPRAHHTPSSVLVTSPLPSGPSHYLPLTTHLFCLPTSPLVAAMPRRLVSAYPLPMGTTERHCGTTRIWTGMDDSTR